MSLTAQNDRNFFSEIKRVYQACSLGISDFSIEKESTEYEACRFRIDQQMVIGRTAKITPKKIGQFVTCWQRNKDGITMPFSTADQFDLLVINIYNKNRKGQFVFPKTELVTQGIISTTDKDGKRGFRIYPVWDEPTSQQGKKSQRWQLKFFLEYTQEVNIEFVKKLFTNNTSC